MFGLLCKKGLGGITLLLTVPLVALGCGDLENAGADRSGSVFNVTGLTPTYFDEATRQVDIVRSICDDGKAEPFTDHFAEVTFTNEPLPNSEEQTASTIYLTAYELDYEPLTTRTPQIPTFNLTRLRDRVGIPPCEPGSTCSGTTYPGLDYVPVRIKNKMQLLMVLAQLVDPTIIQFQYNVHYKFYGKNDFGEKVSAEAWDTFLAANYLHCEGG